MSALEVFLAFALLVLSFMAVYFLSNTRLERRRRALVAEVLPPGVSLDEFVASAPFAYTRDPKGFKVWEKHKSIDQYAHIALTEEEAKHYIVLATVHLQKQGEKQA